MGKFFKALEQAERERALREQALQHATPAGTVPAPSAPPREEPILQPTAEPSDPPVAQSVFHRPIGKEPVPEPQAAREISRKPPEGVEEHLVSLLTPTSFGAEQYRALRHRVEQLHKTTNLSIVGISSPAIGDGKTITTINLAGALAQAPEARVLIVDIDLRRSSVAQCLGLDGSPDRGLVEAILDQGLSLHDVVESCPPFNLSVVRGGRRPSAPYELLKSPRLGQLLEEARRHYDYVLLDMPPLVPLPDCRVIGRWVDSFLVVVAAHKTPRKLVEEALNVLEPTTIIGLIFNSDDRPVSGFYSRYGRSQDGALAGWWGGARPGRRSDFQGTQ